MKNLLKKATMLLCAMAVAIGFVGGTVEEASAASKKVYGGTSKIIINVPTGQHDLSYTINYSKKAKKNYITNALTNSSGRILWTNFKKKGIVQGSLTHSATENGEYTIGVIIKDRTSKKEICKSLNIKLSDLAKYNFKINIKDYAGDYGTLKDFSISKVKK